jgi:hypothetical protein
MYLGLLVDNCLLLAASDSTHCKSVLRAHFLQISSVIVKAGDQAAM